jgi:hypothetical protein
MDQCLLQDITVALSLVELGSGFYIFVRGEGGFRRST